MRKRVVHSATLKHRADNMDKNQKREMREGIKKTIKRLAVAHFMKGNKWYRANLHVASVLCICCFIDSLGKHIYGGDAKRCKFNRFIENYMPNFYKALVSKAVKEKKAREFYLELFYSCVRSGLVHEYFPRQKKMVGVEIKSGGCKQIVSGGSNKLVICLPELRKEFENIVDKAFRDVL